MQFDLETLHLSSALGRCAYLIVFTIVAVRNPGERCHWHWIGAIFASMIGSTIMARVPTTRWMTFAEAWVIYTFFAGSLALSWSGLREFHGKSVPIRTLAWMIFVPGLVYGGMMLAGVPLRVALSAAVVAGAAYAALGAYEAVQRSQGQRLWSAYIVAGALGSYAVMLCLTLVLLVATDIPMNSTESATASMIVDQASGILIYFGYIAMANERALLTIERLAYTDPLTDLVNRRGLQIKLAQIHSNATPEGVDGVLLVDIDHFKAINDTYGHDAGDAVLATFSQRLRDSMRRSDIVARWGGEEFLVILPKTGFSDLFAVAERLRRTIEAEPFALPDAQPIRVTISVGISEMVLDGFEEAMRQADSALYKAKTCGRNRVCGTRHDRIAPLGMTA
ncbi:GGDEF domain-containing protein [Fulvimarina sp. 2208YS6-2-32]|uniref:diguanylate cyclase n=1 Tax=Fulvimarina uroteuthidis TaxID=3098149 RepID=A0ABU5HWK5_9HYPH|nr:GGDEF domain-containing protein [Fulvimarina sp. 2208YS6-2-32]MDY8107537.1 GGDEF domain-containing protein [Fulvimarina sp. 2208YS6-2-32]